MRSDVVPPHRANSQLVVFRYIAGLVGKVDVVAIGVHEIAIPAVGLVGVLDNRGLLGAPIIAARLWPG
ncbi:hypothetical protein [Bradyrhizobium sp. 142]|uniref:hypothetical protein n=1 Tax=Bradyrhizobium sp. 142 TaxID=2782618 RepID=UPI001FFA8DE7|nr:hypothetical protein [Bradyrhizobium sp. 142]MCK1710744.1 hypothetical protein [Bradyrhizobium sp. 143]MCK1724423.1 hypothetical protein [Bradyrhizobium sp. 142]